MKTRVIIISALVVSTFSVASFACDGPKKCGYKGKKVSEEVMLIPQKEIERTENSVDITVAVADMDCGDCPTKIEEALNSIKGVQGASASYGLGKVSVTYDKSLVKVDAIIKAISDIGYTGTLSKEGEV